MLYLRGLSLFMSKNISLLILSENCLTLGQFCWAKIGSHGHFLKFINKQNKRKKKLKNSCHIYSTLRYLLYEHFIGFVHLLNVN